MLFNAHLCNHILLQKWWWDLGHSSVHCSRCGLWESGCRRLSRKRLYAEDRGLQVPMALDHRPVISRGKAAPGPDPRIRHRIQIGMFRPIRVDHTNCLQVAIKTHSFIYRPSNGPMHTLGNVIDSGIGLSIDGAYQV